MEGKWGGREDICVLWGLKNIPQRLPWYSLLTLMGGEVRLGVKGTVTPVAQVAAPTPVC